MSELKFDLGIDYDPISFSQAIESDNSAKCMAKCHVRIVKINWLQWGFGSCRIA